jgi:hypothetical protein
LQNLFARLFPADTTNAEGMKRNTETGELTMNFTARLNKILKATGITVEATWVHALGRFDVWATYHNGYEVKETFLNGITRDAEAAAVQITDRVLAWESR